MVATCSQSKRVEHGTDYFYDKDAMPVDGPHVWDQNYLAKIRSIDYDDPVEPEILPAMSGKTSSRSRSRGRLLRRVASRRGAESSHRLALPLCRMSAHPGRVFDLPRSPRSDALSMSHVREVCAWDHGNRCRAW